MNKLFLPTAVLLLLMMGVNSCSFFKGKQNNDRTNDNLVGDVMQVTENQFMAVQNFDEVKKGEPYRPDEGDWDWIRRYDREGNLEVIIQISMIGDTIGYTRFEYDTEHPTQKKSQLDYNKDGVLVMRTDKSYDEQGREIRSYTTDASGRPVQVTTMEYVGSDKKTVHYTGDGKVQFKTIETMNSKNCPLSTIQKNASDQVIGLHKDSWKGELRDSTVFYDENGQKASAIGFDYDQYGNLINQHGVDGQGNPFLPVVYKYKYDGVGNWYECVKYNGDKPEYVIERIIDYYPKKK